MHTAHLQQQQKLLITISENVQIYQQVKLLVEPRKVVEPDGKVADVLQTAVNVGVQLSSTGDIRHSDSLFLATRRRDGERLITSAENKQYATNV